MKAKIKVTKEVDIKYLHVSAGVRYWEDTEVNGAEDTEGELIPCKRGDRWEPLIDIDMARIVNWKQGTIADVHYKVCDDGVYQLQDAQKKTLITHDGYVPAIMCPEENGYGDYIIMKIDENGYIANFGCDISDMIGEDE